MKVLAINGSPRKEGNTMAGIKIVLEELEKQGIETEIFQLGGNLVRGCTACYKCFETKDGFCSTRDDIINQCLVKMYKSDGIIIGSPVYFGSVTTEVKALIDRGGLCARAGGYLLKRKVGASVIAVRRQGATNVYDQINYLYALNQVIIPTSIYWNMGMGRNPGEILNDKEGIETFKILGENMAWLMKKLFAA